MGFFDGIVESILSPIMGIIKDAITAVVSPVLNAVIDVFKTLFTPIIEAFVPFIVQLFQTLIPAFLDALGLGWLPNLLLSLLYIVLYGGFLVGYGFGMMYLRIVLEFLPIYFLLFLLFLPFIPLFLLIYIFITVHIGDISSASNLLNGIVDAINNTVNDTINFFIDNWLQVIIQLSFIIIYMIFMTAYDLITGIELIAAQIAKIGIFWKAILNIAIFFPVWWFIYAFFFQNKDQSDFPSRVMNSIQSILDTGVWFFQWCGDKVVRVVKVFTG